MWVRPAYLPSSSLSSPHKTAPLPPSPPLTWLPMCPSDCRYSSWLGACRPQFTSPFLSPCMDVGMGSGAGEGALMDDAHGEAAEEPRTSVRSYSSSPSSSTLITSSSRHDSSSDTMSSMSIRGSSSPFSLELAGLRHPLLLQQHRAALKAAKQQAEAARKVHARLRARPGTAVDRLVEAEGALEERKGEVSCDDHVGERGGCLMVDSDEGSCDDHVGERGGCLIVDEDEGSCDGHVGERGGCLIVDEDEESCDDSQISHGEYHRGQYKESL